MAITFDDLQPNTILLLFFLTILFFALSLPILIILLVSQIIKKITLSISRALHSFQIFGNIYVKVICSLYLVFYISGLLRKVTDRGGRRA